MNKYSVIAIILAIVIGFTTGSLLTISQKNKEIAKLTQAHKLTLLKENKITQLKIDSVNNRISQVLKTIEKDSVLIESLKHKIKMDGVVYEKRLKEVKNLTPDEKSRWIIDYYTKSDSLQN